MGTNIVLGFAFLILLFVAYRWVSWRAAKLRRPRVGRPGGAAVLRMPPGHNLLLGVLALGPGGLLAAMSLTVQWKPGSEANGPILAAAVGLPTLAIASLLFAQEARQRIRVDDRGVERMGVFGSRRLSWEEVGGIAYNAQSRWFVLRGSAGRVWIAETLDGIVDFAEIALARLPRRVLDESPDARDELRDLVAP